MATLTSLSTLINRMQRWQEIAKVDETYLVRDLDEALRAVQRQTNLPWTLQKSSLKVFKDVLEYPVASDHKDLAIVDNSKSESRYDLSARFRFTSIQEFYENPDYRNDLAEIWDGNTRYLGVRYTPDNAPSQLIDTADITTNYTASGDASAITQDIVNYKEGNASVRFTNTVSSGTATVEKTFTSFSDTNYKNKYFFVWVYLSAVPTSITLRFGSDNLDYYYASSTAQFSGQAFKANQWNLIAMDLNTASTTGAPDTTAFAYFAVQIVGGAAGYYNIDSSYLRQWSLMDYWYYSANNVALTGSATANQQYFRNDSDVYSLDSSLVGESEFADVIMYQGLIYTATDVESVKLKEQFKESRDEAWNNLLKTHPSMKPLIITQRYRFITDPTSEDSADIHP